MDKSQVAMMIDNRSSSVGREIDEVRIWIRSRSIMVACGQLHIGCVRMLDKRSSRLIDSCAAPLSLHIEAIHRDMHQNQSLEGASIEIHATAFVFDTSSKLIRANQPRERCKIATLLVSLHANETLGALMFVFGSVGRKRAKEYVEMDSRLDCVFGLGIM